MIECIILIETVINITLLAIFMYKGQRRTYGNIIMDSISQLMPKHKASESWNDVNKFYVKKEQERIH